MVGESDGTGDGGSWREWEAPLRALCEDVRRASRGALLEALRADQLESLTRIEGQGAGDVTYGIDRAAEDAVSRWLEETARRRSLSLLTEDTGWRHFGPAPVGGLRELADFDHGGPRIAIDPIDGTRHLMSDLRSAWTVVSLAPPGATTPTLEETAGAIVSELADSRAANFRRLVADERACYLEEVSLEGPLLRPPRRLEDDGDARVDRGYFPFFSYMHDLRPGLARLQADFFERLAREEGADVRNCYDDQYITNGGQLVLLALGTYRLIVDARAWLAARLGRTTVTSKPYDVAGAMHCARLAGCALTDLEGRPLSFELDTETPISFVGYANAGTRARLEPHLQAAREAGAWRG